MPNAPANDQPVPNPTYNGNIKAFFKAGDIRCMRSQGIDLGSYDGVRHHATDIYEQTKSGNMPQGGERWSEAWVQTFLNWIKTGFPLGAEPVPTPVPTPRPDPAGPVRLRKNLDALSADEIALLKQAFAGIIAKDPKPGTPLDQVDPQSYFGLASLHGLPLGYCMHHVDGYNPWHRRYMLAFEDALRAVPGCGDVTLPYWDITQKPPALLYEAPFAHYTLPIGIGDDGYYPAGYVTERYDAETIIQTLDNDGVPTQIAEALGAKMWGAFNGGGFQQYIIQGHDNGHVDTGLTMSDQTVAAYDPIFWFFHCNWERLWQSWQVLADATTVNGFIDTLNGNTEWLSLSLDPYSDTSTDTIVWPQVSYDVLAAAPANPHPLMAGHVMAANAFTITSDDRVSLRVKGIDRMNISGTFVVKLLADGEQIGRQAFFQARSPRECKTCRRHSLVDIDFRLPRERVIGRRLSIAIEASAHGKTPATHIPLETVGNPEVNIRFLLEGE